MKCCELTQENKSMHSVTSTSQVHTVSYSVLLSVKTKAVQNPQKDIHLKNSFLALSYEFCQNSNCLYKFCQHYSEELFASGKGVKFF